MIKKIRFEITSGGYAEMAHLAFFIRNVRLGVNTTDKTLTLKNGTVHTFTCTASSEYGSGYTTLGIFTSSSFESAISSTLLLIYRLFL